MPLAVGIVIDIFVQYNATRRTIRNSTLRTISTCRQESYKAQGLGSARISVFSSAEVKELPQRDVSMAGKRVVKLKLGSDFKSSRVSPSIWNIYSTTARVWAGFRRGSQADSYLMCKSDNSTFNPTHSVTSAPVVSK